MRCSYIAVDWDATTLRAHAVAQNGAVIRSVELPDGIQVVQGDFEGALKRALDTLSDVDEVARCPVLMAGMIGSRQGWVEVPYANTPCDVSALAAQLPSVPNALGRSIFIVPGVADLSGAAPDVMRGEETQLVGLLASLHASDLQVCMPGTHCKWISIKGGKIAALRTYMTGEAFNLFSERSMLARLMVPNPGEGGEDTDDWAAFDEGLACAWREGHLLHQLFSVRTDALFGRRAPATLKSYLAGLLIGHEVHDAGAACTGDLVLVGDGRLTQRYERALTRRGLRYSIAPDDIVVTGLSCIAAKVGWLPAAATVA